MSKSFSRGVANPVTVGILACLVLLLALLSYGVFKLVNKPAITVDPKLIALAKQLEESDKKFKDLRSMFENLKFPPSTSPDVAGTVKTLLADYEEKRQAKQDEYNKKLEEAKAAAAAGEQARYDALAQEANDLKEALAKQAEEFAKKLAEVTKTPEIPPTDPKDEKNDKNQTEQVLGKAVLTLLNIVCPGLGEMLGGLMGDPEVRDAVENIAKSAALGNPPNPEDLKKVAEAAAKDPQGPLVKTLNKQLANTDPASFGGKVLTAMGESVAAKSKPGWGDSFVAALNASSFDADTVINIIPKKQDAAGQTKSYFANDLEKTWAMTEASKKGSKALAAKLDAIEVTP